MNSITVIGVSTAKVLGVTNVVVRGVVVGVVVMVVVKKNESRVSRKEEEEIMLLFLLFCEKKSCLKLFQPFEVSAFSFSGLLFQKANQRSFY